ncbi:MAG: carboxypeptidase regulatory-like domain-containing protein [Acidobacteriota bacterium]
MSILRPTTAARATIGVLLILCLGASPGISAERIEGKIRLVEKGNDKTRREARHAVVYFRPQEPVEVEPAAEPFEIATVRKEFLPRVLTVPVGSTVRFPNQDPILHNVFSVSGKNRFDLGLYRGGEAKGTVFHEPGIVRVFCNVHHSMVAYVVVVDTPYYATLDSQGAFEITGLPPGPGELTVWHERAEPKTLRYVVGSGGTLDLELAITKPRVPRHRNKFGKPYGRKRRGKAYP